MSIENACWVWDGRAEAVNAYVQFRHSFTAGEGEACLHICAGAQYDARLNGESVGCGQYSDYPDCRSYDAIPCRTTAGENTLLVTVWSPGADSSVYRAGRGGLLYELTDAGGAVLARSGEGTLSRPHPHYLGGPMENITNQLGFSFAYDAEKEGLPYERARLLDDPVRLQPRPVRAPEVLPRKKAELVTQGVFLDAKIGAGPTAGEAMQRAYLSHRPLKELTGLRERPALPCEEGVRVSCTDGDGLYLLIDLGEEEAGFLDLDIALDGPADLLIGWGEHTDDLRLRTSVGGRSFAARCRAPAGRSRFTHRLRRLGLRYLELLVYAHGVTLYYAGVLPTVYPVKGGAYFRTADAMHRAIYDVSVRTLRLCMHEHYEDCPWREQALYAMDSRNQMLCGYLALGEYDMPRESIRLLAKGLREDGLLELCAPARVPVTIPSFTAVFLVQLREYQMFSGDGAFVREMLPAARTIARKLCARVDGTGLIPAWTGKGDWNFYEWTEGLDGYERPDAEGAPRCDAPMNAFAVMGLRALADAEDALGGDGGEWRAAADGIARSAHAAFFDAGRGIYATYLCRGEKRGEHELTQALMAAAGIAPEDVLESVLGALKSDSLAPVTLAYSIFKFEALLKRRENAEWVFARIARDWGRMLRGGATSFWETMRGARDFSDAGSLCHGWSAVPVWFYFTYVLGIRSDGHGGLIEAEKLPCGLSGSEGRAADSAGRTVVSRGI